MLGCKSSTTPIETTTKKKKKKKDDRDKEEDEEEEEEEEENDGKDVGKGRYQRLVGKFIYLSHTRPDIAFAVSIASQHSHA